MLPTLRDGNTVFASIHCSTDSPATNLSWFCDGVQITTNITTRLLYPNGTLTFDPLIVGRDLSPEGVRYYCMLSNAFGSVISRTAILQQASKLKVMLVYSMYA